MRGGVARWKRGIAGHGLRAALAYALDGACDVGAAHEAARSLQGADAAAGYADDRVTRHVVTEHGIERDQLDARELRAWISGANPRTREHRGRDLSTPDSDLLFDATVNAPKTFSLAAALDDELATEFAALQDRIRDRTITMWRQELNARRGAGGKQRMSLARIEVVELQHERSRSLDPHSHRHMWLSAKVLGHDGKWSSVDSRVMLRFHTIVNAEGDLAARTDPQWIAALSRRGLAIDPVTGEIAQLAAMVPGMSRRSQQIEAAKRVALAKWRADHPGAEPSKMDLLAIDRWAWAHGRPDKPEIVDEDEWRQAVRDELNRLDPDACAAVTGQRPPAAPTDLARRDVAAVQVPMTGHGVQPDQLDAAHLATIAVAEADARATASSGRFSEFALRAAAIRAVATAGVAAADRASFDEVVAATVACAKRDLLMDFTPPHTTGRTPGHVAALMATETAILKRDVDAGLAELAREPGRSADAATVAAVASRVTDRPLDEGQAAAAAAVAGTDRLVTVTGPAGAGKTTMLRVAKALMHAEGRHMLVVAPTKKAAAVAGRETGASAASLHALLHDAGWRWKGTAARRSEWSRLRAGDVDPATGNPWTGPRMRLRPTTCIVVDEAGMVDLAAADALLSVVRESGARIAFVGDALQLSPVGHHGAMQLAEARTKRAVTLEQVHRFRNADGSPDDEFGTLTKRIRQIARQANPDEAEAIATTLDERGQIIAVGDVDEAHSHMTAAWLAARASGRTTALVVATNDEAATLNARIQAERIARGQLGGATVDGRDGASIYVGDLVQTRRNDSGADVENRALWTVRHVSPSGVVLESADVPGHVRTVTADYTHDQVQLAYAATAHAVQGETVSEAIVAPGVDGAGLYVGLTRGRTSNIALAIAKDQEAAVRAVAAQLGTGQTELTARESREAVQFEVEAAAAGADHRPPTWRDRPAGHLADIDRAIGLERAKLTTPDAELRELRDRIELEEAAARANRLRATVRAARGPLGQPAAATDADEAAATSAFEVKALRAELDKREAADAATRDRLDVLMAERAIRDHVLDPATAQREEHERRQALLSTATPQRTRVAPRPEQDTAGEHRPVTDYEPTPSSPGM